MEDNLSEALEVVKAQASVRYMTEEEMISMIQNLAENLKKIGTGAPEAPPQEPPVDPKKAIKEKSIVCLECGKSFKVLTKKHLATHNLTPEQYKEKWGFKKNASLVCKSLSRERRKKMQEMKLWEKRRSANK